MLIDWGKLVSQGRAKAPGISWSNEEGRAVAYLAQTLGKKMAEVAPYVRKGILTVEAYKKAEGKPGMTNPYMKLSKEDLIKKVQSLEISVSPDATKEILAQILLEKKQATVIEKKAEAPATKGGVATSSISGGSGPVSPSGATGETGKTGIKFDGAVLKTKPKAKAKKIGKSKK